MDIMNKKLNNRKIIISFGDDKPIRYDFNILLRHQRKAYRTFYNQYKEFHEMYFDSKHSPEAIDIPDDYISGLYPRPRNITKGIELSVLELRKEGEDIITNKKAREKYKSIFEEKIKNVSTVSEALKSIEFLESKGRNKRDAYYIFKQGFDYEELERTIVEEIAV
jgi:hypothetical protein